jgi:hypothetical protein
MSIRQTLAGEGVIITRAFQVAEFVNTERIHRKISFVRFGSMCNQSAATLSNVLGSHGNHALLATVIPWLVPFNWRLTLGGVEVRDTRHACQMLDSRRIEMGVSVSRAQRENIHNWNRIRGIAVNGKYNDGQENLSLDTVVRAGAYVDWELRLSAKPIQSKRVKRYLALGIAPEHATKASA